ncbi:MAG: Fis family transcriptional regulator [Rhodocyclales bacterium GT-UBC]|nr:MAG: Fis family transcriptional regulator [Rhodocyclales bacterium GT-UBC]
MIDQDLTRYDAAGQLAADESAALARVVAVEPGLVWLEPMQTGSCGGCASAAACGSKGIGTIANRLEARRFAVPGHFALRVGDSVEVAFGNRNLVRAATVAYVVPLLSAFGCAGVAQSLAGQDGLTLLGAVFGLLAGFVAMKFVARRLEAGGALQARIVRRHLPTIDFSYPGAQCDA